MDQQQKTSDQINKTPEKWQSEPCDTIESEETFQYQEQNETAFTPLQVINEAEPWFISNQHNFEALDLLQFIENYHEYAQQKGEQMTLNALFEIVKDLNDRCDQSQVWQVFQGYPYKRYIDLVQVLFDNIQQASQEIQDDNFGLQSKINNLNEELESQSQRYLHLEALNQDYEQEIHRLQEELLFSNTGQRNVEKLNNEIEDLTKKLTESETDYLNLQSQFNTLKQINEELEEDRDRLDRERQKANGKLNKLEFKQLEKQEQQFVNAPFSSRTMNSARSYRPSPNYQEQIDITEEQFEVELGSSSSSESEEYKLKDPIQQEMLYSKLEEKYLNIKNDYKFLLQKFNTKVSDFQQLKEDYIALNQKNTRLTKEKDALNADNKEISSLLEQQGLVIEQQDNEIAKLKEANAYLEEQKFDRSFNEENALARSNAMDKTFVQFGSTFRLDTNDSRRKMSIPQKKPQLDQEYFQNSFEDSQISIQRPSCFRQSDSPALQQDYFKQRLSAKNNNYFRTPKAEQTEVQHFYIMEEDNELGVSKQESDHSENFDMLNLRSRDSHLGSVLQQTIDDMTHPILPPNSSRKFANFSHFFSSQITVVDGSLQKSAAVLLCMEKTCFVFYEKVPNYLIYEPFDLSTTQLIICPDKTSYAAFYLTQQKVKQSHIIFEIKNIAILLQFSYYMKVKINFLKEFVLQTDNCMKKFQFEKIDQLESKAQAIQTYYQGYLYKKPNKGILGSIFGSSNENLTYDKQGWQMQFWILTNVGLLVFDQKDFTKPSVLHPLYRLQLIPSQKERPNCFSLKTHSTDWFTLCATNSSTYTQWVTTIQKTINRVKSQPQEFKLQQQK